MPLYEYACEACGPFEAWSTMDKAAAPCRCPDCDRTGSRQIAAPMLAAMNGTLRNALERADRSSSEPAVVSRNHLGNCGCRMCGSGKAVGSRRWALGH